MAFAAAFCLFVLFLEYGFGLDSGDGECRSKETLVCYYTGAKDQVTID